MIFTVYSHKFWLALVKSRWKSVRGRFREFLANVFAFLPIFTDLNQMLQILQILPISPILLILLLWNEDFTASQA